MRRALNVLQVCHAAYDLIGETEIYNCTGNPHPADIETIVNSMLSDEFTTSYQSQSQISLQDISDPFLLFLSVISAMKTEKGLALQDLLTGAYEYIETIDFKPQARIYLLDYIATAEYVFLSEARSNKLIFSNRHRLSTGASEKIQLTALLGAFKVAVELSAKTS
jgi:replication factor C subunit 3/5